MSNKLSSDDVKEFLRDAGLLSYGDLLIDVFEKPLDRSSPSSRQDFACEQVERRNYAASLSAEDGPVYLGAGCYDHLVPSLVERFALQVEYSRMNASVDSEIVDELQRALFAFQRKLSRLTGMESTNASLYRGCGNALAHSCFLATETTRRKLVLAPETLGSERLNTLKSFAQAYGVELRAAPSRNGLVDLELLRETLRDEGERVAATIVPYPNFYGNLERVGQICEATRRVGAVMIMTVDPVALATLRSPAEWGADVVAGDVHATPIHQDDGDVRLGFVSASRRFLSTAPTRLVRRVEDSFGGTAYYLSRDFGAKTNAKESPKNVERVRGALRTLAYLAYADLRDLRRAAVVSHQIARHARAELAKVGFVFHHSAPFLREFAVKVDDPRGMLDYLEGWGISGGYELRDGLLLAFTEKRSVEEVDELVFFMKEYRDKGRNVHKPSDC